MSSSVEEWNKLVLSTILFVPVKCRNILNFYHVSCKRKRLTAMKDFIMVYYVDRPLLKETIDYLRTFNPISGDMDNIIESVLKNF